MPIQAEKELNSQVYSALRVLFSGQSLESAWSQVCSRFHQWTLELPAPVSPLTQGLYFMQLLCDYFDPEVIKSDPNIAKALLQGALEINDSVELDGQSYKVVCREIGSNFGVVYTLQDRNGKVIRHEFFD